MPSCTRVKKGRGKDVVVLSCDYRNDVSKSEIQTVTLPVIEKNGYTLFEEITTPNSNFQTVGILYADIVGYLTARIDTISNDIELFESIPPEELENNGKVKKLNSSQELMEKIKQLEKYRLVSKSK